MPRTQIITPDDVEHANDRCRTCRCQRLVQVSMCSDGVCVQDFNRGIQYIVSTIDELDITLTRALRAVVGINYNN